MGESSRSLYERSREHQADRDSMLEESHQVKHWLLHHQELKGPPAFRYKIIASFKDPMTRQLSEAVRIELRGSEVLNSKSEYSRCRVPRLRVDLEGWKQKQSKESTNQAEPHLNEEAEKSLQEDSSNNKRKKDQGEGINIQTSTRKSKRRKLECLVGWGDGTSLQGGVEEDTLPEGWEVRRIFSEVGDQDDNITDRLMKQVTLPLGWRGCIKKDSSGTGNHAPTGVAQPERDNTDADDHTHTAEVEIALGMVSTGDNATEQPGVGDVEEKSQIDKEDIPKGWQETEKKTSTFQFKKRGKLNANEVVELKKTHRSLFDWVNVEAVPILLRRIQWSGKTMAGR